MQAHGLLEQNLSKIKAMIRKLFARIIDLENINDHGSNARLINRSGLVLVSSDQCFHWARLVIIELIEDLLGK